MKLRAKLNTPRSGRLPFTAELREEGWYLDLLHHRCLTDKRGETEGGYNLGRLLINEGLSFPEATPGVLEKIWDDVTENELSERAAQTRFDALCRWIEATTKAAPSDSELYYAV